MACVHISSVHVQAYLHISIRYRRAGALLNLIRLFQLGLLDLPPTIEYQLTWKGRYVYQLINDLWNGKLICGRIGKRPVEAVLNLHPFNGNMARDFLVELLISIRCYTTAMKIQTKTNVGRPAHSPICNSLVIFLVEVLKLLKIWVMSFFILI